MLIIQNRDGGLKQDIKPSKFCSVHPDKLVMGRGLCKNCYDKWLKLNNPEYLERQKENCRKWQEINKEKQKEKRKKRTAKQDPEYRFNSRLRHFYNITPDDYNNMVSKQNGVCAICQKPPKEEKRLHIDHDHNTGLIRGLLCFRCNFGLTYFAENHEIMNRGAEYLKTSEERGKQWTDELNKSIKDRKDKENLAKEEFNKQFLNKKTKDITEDEKVEMQRLYQNNKTTKEIMEVYPQYSKSAIWRASRNKSARSTKMIEDKKLPLELDDINWFGKENNIKE